MQYSFLDRKNQVAPTLPLRGVEIGVDLKAGGLGGRYRRHQYLAVQPANLILTSR